MSRLPEEEHLNKAFGWAARETSGLKIVLISKATREKDVAFKVFYCEICHTDLHNGKNDWGQVTEVESKVEKLKVGDKVGVGCMVGFCHSGDNCTNNLENYCPKLIATYGGNRPLLSAEITVYSPLTFYGLDKPDLHIRVIGLGGIGHLAIKFDKAMRAKAVNGTLDGIIDTVSAQHPLLPLLGLLKTHGKLVLFGALEKPLELPTFPLLQVKQSIKPNIEIIPIDYVNTAIELLLKVDVKCQFVIDIGNMLKPTS
ncbi:hypothetical protein GOBAR_DD18558 [Gossypium barbadense]|nr:hypothetical protein GOBAR_DD18558 [Gossypium barbadense]